MGSLKINTQMTSTPNLIMRWVQIQKTYGITYLFSWAHRVTGVGLILFLWFHIYTLSYLNDPAVFDLKMQWYARMGMAYFEWLLALPVIFHALNGGRLILYEIFGNRRDKLLTTWIAGLTLVYCLVLILVMYVSNISMDSSTTWVIAWLFSLGLAGVAIRALLKSTIGIYWKIQRISGAFLMIIIPVHLVFMHVNPQAGHDSAVILSRIRGDILIRVTDFFIVVSALYHGAYGLISIGKDYLNSRVLIQYLSILIIIVSVLLGWIGIKTVIIL